MRGTLCRKAQVLAAMLAFAPAVAMATATVRHEAAGAAAEPVSAADAALAAFADAPSWASLEVYAWQIDQAWRMRGEPGLPPKDPALEAMKAELAKGFYGAPATPRLDMGRLRRLAAEAQRPDTAATDHLAASQRVTAALQLWAPPFYENTPEGNPRPLAVVQAIDLPPVRTSFFRDDGALAAAHEDPEALSGRFGIVHRWVTTPAKPPTPESAEYPLYDITAYTHLLVRPLQRAVLMRDGRLQVAPSHARRRHAAWNEHGCDGWHPGFAHGDLAADDSAWHAFDDGEGGVRAARADAGQVPGSVYTFWLPTPSPLPHAAASLSTREQALDRDATGFVRATTLVYDLDRDAVPDLLVWEATGDGPGHMDESTGTDDTWYRLVLVNIRGHWKVLGTDQFSYGCGC